MVLYLIFSVKVINTSLNRADDILNLFEFIVRISNFDNFPNILNSYIVRSSWNFPLQCILLQSQLIQTIFGCNSIITRFQLLEFLNIKLNLVVSLSINFPLQLTYCLIEVVIIENQLNRKICECLPIKGISLKELLDFVQIVVKDYTIFENLCKLLEVVFDSINGDLCRVYSIGVSHSYVWWKESNGGM